MPRHPYLLQRERLPTAAVNDGEVEKEMNWTTTSKDKRSEDSDSSYPATANFH